jgi:hypothetical protein
VSIVHDRSSQFLLSVLVFLFLFFLIESLLFVIKLFPIWFSILQPGRGLHRCNAVDVTHSSGSSSTDRLHGKNKYPGVGLPSASSSSSTSSPRRLFQPGLQRVPGVATLATVARNDDGGEDLPPRNRKNTIRAEDVSPVDDPGDDGKDILPVYSS